jgi:hypothetical protein
MTTQIQRRRGTTAQHSTFTGANGEVTVDTDKEVLVVHDGAQAGGYPQMRENGSNSALALGSAATPSLKFTGDTNTGIYSPGADQVAISTNGTGRLFVASDGKIGCGIAAPSYGLQLINSASSFALGETGSNVRFVLNYASPTSSTAAPTITSDGEGLYYFGRNGYTGQHVFYSGPSNTERMRLTSTGLLGLGTSSPGALLSINSSYAGYGLAAITDGSPLVAITGGRDKFIRIDGGAYQGGTSTASIHLSNSGASNYNLASGHLLQSGCFDNGSSNSNYFTISSSSYSGSAYTYTERLRIDSSGRVGIGSTVPRALLDIGGSAAFSGGTYQAPKLAVSNGYISVKSDPADGASRLTLIGDSATGDGVIDWGGNIASSLKFTNNGTERGRWDSSGRFLVGTSTATNNLRLDEKFAIVGTTANYPGMAITGYTGGAGGTDYSPLIELKRSRGTTDGSFTKVESGDALGKIMFLGADGSSWAGGAYIEAFVDGATSAGDLPTRLAFSTTADGASSPTERMRIGQNGYIQCSETGTYSPDGGSGWHKFYQSANQRCIQTYSTSGSFTNSALTQYIAAGGGTGSGFATGYSDTGSIQRYIIYSNGNLVNYNNAYGAISDLKLKENIIDAPTQWDDIKRIRVRKYNFKQGGAHTQIGLIAQEVELVSPGLVTESPDRDTEGNDLGTVTKSVNYSVLYMKAVKALQEAMERIEALEADVAQLKSA